MTRTTTRRGVATLFIKRNLMKQLRLRSHFAAARETSGMRLCFKTRTARTMPRITSFSSRGTTIHHCGAALPFGFTDWFSVFMSASVAQGAGKGPSRPRNYGQKLIHRLLTPHPPPLDREARRGFTGPPPPPPSSARGRAIQPARSRARACPSSESIARSLPVRSSASAIARRPPAVR